MKCHKHPFMAATRVLKKDGEEFWLCPDCAWRALKAGEWLWCPEDGSTIGLDDEDNLLELVKGKPVPVRMREVEE